MNVMLETKNLDERLARCPRCGYDLRGTMETWKHECPIRAVCAECGLDFEWAELLNPFLIVPRWCIEYAIGKRDYCQRICLSFQYALWPPKFWSQLKMSHEPQRKRIIVFLFVMFGVMYATFAFGQGMSAVGHWMERSVVAGRTYSTNGYEIAFKTMLLPFSDEPLGKVTMPGWTGNMAAPSDYMNHWRDRHDIGVFILSFAMACPLVFLALPHSMRRAKVRWVHIGRICTYGLFMIMVTLLFIIMAESVLQMPNSVIAKSIQGLFEQTAYFMTWLIIPFLMYWWHSAIVKYLKMADSWKIWLSVVTISLLFALAVMFHTYPGRLVRFVEVLLYS